VVTVVALVLVVVVMAAVSVVVAGAFSDELPERDFSIPDVWSSTVGKPSAVGQVSSFSLRAVDFCRLTNCALDEASDVNSSGLASFLFSTVVWSSSGRLLEDLLCEGSVFEIVMSVYLSRERAKRVSMERLTFSALG
jgi:hypothetical protein